LFAFCDESEHEKLREIWESEKFIFADDRMHYINDLLGTAAMYDSADIPEGYQPVYPPA